MMVVYQLIEVLKARAIGISHTVDEYVWIVTYESAESLFILTLLSSDVMYVLRGGSSNRTAIYDHALVGVLYRRACV